MKGLWLPSDQPETQGQKGGEEKGREGKGGEGEASLPPSPKKGGRAWGFLGSRLGPRQNMRVVKSTFPIPTGVR